MTTKQELQEQLIKLNARLKILKVSNPRSQEIFSVTDNIANIEAKLARIGTGQGTRVAKLRDRLQSLKVEEIDLESQLEILRLRSPSSSRINPLECQLRETQTEIAELNSRLGVGKVKQRAMMLNEKDQDAKLRSQVSSDAFRLNDGEWHRQEEEELVRRRQAAAIRRGANSGGASYGMLQGDSSLEDGSSYGVAGRVQSGRGGLEVAHVQSDRVQVHGAEVNFATGGNMSATVKVERAKANPFRRGNVEDSSQNIKPQSANPFRKGTTATVVIKDAEAERKAKRAEEEARRAKLEAERLAREKNSELDALRAQLETARLTGEREKLELAREKERMALEHQRQMNDAERQRMLAEEEHQRSLYARDLEHQQRLADMKTRAQKEQRSSSQGLKQQYESELEGMRRNWEEQYQDARTAAIKQAREHEDLRYRYAQRMMALDGKKRGDATDADIEKFQKMIGEKAPKSLPPVKFTIRAGKNAAGKKDVVMVTLTGPLRGPNSPEPNPKPVHSISEADSSGAFVVECVPRRSGVYTIHFYLWGKESDISPFSFIINEKQIRWLILNRKTGQLEEKETGQLKKDEGLSGAQYAQKQKQALQNYLEKSSGGSSSHSRSSSRSSSKRSSSRTSKKTAQQAEEERQFKDFISAASEGGKFLKHPTGKFASPKITKVTISDLGSGGSFADAVLSWGDPKKSDRKSIKLKEVKQIQLGKQYFPKADALHDQCFSIITRDKCINLQAPKREVRDKWARGLSMMLDMPLKLAPLT